jgi:hypothetical protein
VTTMVLVRDEKCPIVDFMAKWEDKGMLAISRTSMPRSKVECAWVARCDAMLCGEIR